MNDGISIRPLTDYDEFLACETLQKLAWKMTNDRDVVPAHMLKPIAEHGGIVLGAFDKEAGIVGFVFGFVGRIDDQRAQWLGSPYIFCSEMMGVLPEFRSKSVGYRLKLAQRDYALVQGYRLMVWTYDPLLSLNANLNINKLGCICRHYVEDAYGQLGGIYAGVSTDRFAIEWWIASQHVNNHIEEPGKKETLDTWLEQGIDIINPAERGSDGLLRPRHFAVDASAAQLLVEFPADFQGIKQGDIGLAQAWRAHTRALFEDAFDKGYAVISVVRGAPGREQSSFYVLSNQLDIPSMARGEHED